MPIREDLVSSALTFLSDPNVQVSPLTKRLSFLESKGLTQEEITQFEYLLERLEGTKDSIRESKTWILDHSKVVSLVFIFQLG